MAAENLLGLHPFDMPWGKCALMFMCVCTRNNEPVTPEAVTLGSQAHSGMECQQFRVTPGEQDFLFQDFTQSWQPQAPITEASLFSGQQDKPRSLNFPMSVIACTCSTPGKAAKRLGQYQHSGCHQVEATTLNFPNRPSRFLVVFFDMNLWVE